MSMDVGPDGRVAIQVTSAEAIFQPCSVPGNQHQWLVVGRNPVAHLREWMPHVGFIELDEGRCSWMGSEDQKSGVRSKMPARPIWINRLDHRILHQL